MLEQYHRVLTLCLGPEGTCTQISSLDQLSLTAPHPVGVPACLHELMYVAAPVGIAGTSRRHGDAHLGEFLKEMDFYVYAKHLLCIAQHFKPQCFKGFRLAFALAALCYLRNHISSLPMLHVLPMFPLFHPSL